MSGDSWLSPEMSAGQCYFFVAVGAHQVQPLPVSCSLWHFWQTMPGMLLLSAQW